MSQDPAGEASPPAGPLGLRAAFGLLGGHAAPPAEQRFTAAEVLSALLQGAQHALDVVPEASQDQLDALRDSLLEAMPRLGLQGVTERLLRVLIPPAMPTALATLPAGEPFSREVFNGAVNACYHGLLARGAGDAVDMWWGEFQTLYETQGIEAFLRVFIPLILGSGEFATGVRDAQDNKYRGALIPPSRGVEGIASFISLGSDGYASALLKRYDRKRWSGPFDWLSTSPAIIRAILADDFATFLDPGAYEAIPMEARPDIRFFRSRHRGYEEQSGHPCVLHAADMTDPLGQAYMARCVERFRTQLRGLSSKLVLQVTPEGPDPARDFIQTADSLDAYGRNISFVMVSLLPDLAPGPFPEIEPALSHGPHRLLRMRHMAPLSATEVGDMLDDVLMLRAALAAPGLAGQ